MSKKVTAHKKGMLAESFAVLYLQTKGYQIVRRRYKTPGGEIDIIAKKKDTLAMVEVKSRKVLRDALESVPPRTQKRIEAAAIHFLHAYPQYADLAVRFDVLAFGSGAWPTHLDNAWHARS